MFFRSICVRVFITALALIATMQVGVAGNDIPWSTDIEGSLQRAAATGKPVMLEFTASWCVYCKRMEKSTFVDPSVVNYVNQRFVAVRVDADANKELVADLAIKGLPAILIVSPDLRIIERIPGFQTPEALLTKLKKVPAGESPGIATGNRAIVQNQPATPNHRNVAAPQQRRDLEFEAIGPERTAAVPQPQKKVVQPVSQPQFQETTQRPSSAAAGDEDFFATIHEEMQRPAEKKPERPTLPSAESQKFGFGKEAAPQPLFNGTCVVSAVEEREIIAGSPRYQVNYRGHLLFFSSEDNKQTFLAQPVNYWPMLDGNCAVKMLDDEEKVPGELEYAAFFRKRLWVFSSEENMKEFLNDPAEVAEESQELFESMSGH